MKATEQTSPAQQEYFNAHLRHHRFIRYSRILILIAFLGIWECWANLNII